MKKLFLYLLLVLGFAACRKDMEETTIVDTVYTPPVIKVNGTLAGQVTDEQGQALEGAVVRLGSLQQTTGAGGFFVFRNVVLDANGTFVKVDQPGYFHSSTRIFPKANAENYVRLTLMPRQIAGQINAGSGGTVTTNGGARVKLPANGIVTTDGSAYNGEVQVAARWLDPSDRGMARIMPGNLQGINANREEVSMASYGMLVVELSSPAGDRLNAPATIPLWYFDENAGLWREEGSATRQGDNYVGSVSHFSFWNCDYPFPLVNIEGQLLTEAGNPLTNTLVMIEMISTSQVGSGLTNGDGVFTGKVPAGESLVLRVMDHCGDVAYEQPIGPFTDDANLGAITLDDLSASITNVSGALINCDGDPLPGGLLRLTNEWGGTHFVLADANGQFSKAIMYCNATEISLKGYDLANNVESVQHTFAIATNIGAGDISVCANTISEYIRVT
ncbi:MAG: carboxypeptidase regulatory-like domain-containing protein [Saprospiraceae bacterium]|nr:carboxypeptidase regulatory-like domain-containing protein [Saprospiraceae bacterium]